MARHDPAAAPACRPPAARPTRTAVVEHPARRSGPSGRARERDWSLRFPREAPPYPDPLTGWTGGTDPLAHVELRFPTLEAALRFAAAQGWTVEVRHPPPHRPVVGGVRSFEERPRRPVLGWPERPAASGRPPPIFVGRHPVAPAVSDRAEPRTDPSVRPGAPALGGATRLCRTLAGKE